MSCAWAGQDCRCTGFFNGWWKYCCQAHDYDISLSKTLSDRRQANAGLYE